MHRDTTALVVALFVLAALPAAADHDAPSKAGGIDVDLVRAHYSTLPPLTGLSSVLVRGRGRWLHGLVDDCRRRSPLDGPSETCSIDEAGRSRPATGWSAPSCPAGERQLMSDRLDLPAAEFIHHWRGGC
jgi:hypothetical protein